MNEIMEVTGTKDFFNNWYKYSKFDIIKKIYDYTDNYNPFLFKEFRDEYEKFENGLELDIKNFSKVDEITGKSSVISFGIDEIGDFQLFVNDKEYDGDLFMPTIAKILSPIKLSEVINSLGVRRTTNDEPEAVKPNEIKNSPQQLKTDVVHKNEFDKIFKNDIGFTIFTKMFEFYENETTHLANFSFLFHVMEKEFLVCSQTEFKEFLRNEKYNIEIEKIDSRQSGKNKKIKLYNSIKERYQSNTIKAQ